MMIERHPQATMACLAVELDAHCGGTVQWYCQSIFHAFTANDLKPTATEWLTIIIKCWESARTPISRGVSNLARKYHPDLHPDDKTAKQSSESSSRVRRAARL
jgi:hypothetical protein